MPRGGYVVTKSAGGNLLAGLDMGIAIRFRQWRTVVVDECYSVCALMWLAGVQRAAFSDAEIGFHGAYDVNAFVDPTATWHLNPTAAYAMEPEQPTNMDPRSGNQGRKFGLPGSEHDYRKYQ
jgi:hypothetical protein